MRRLGLLLGLVALSAQSVAAGSPGQPLIFATRDGAIAGYDPVAYFSVDEAVRGKSEFRYRWMDADWYFANEQHVRLFREQPERYAPQYGGYCAYAMSKGQYASTDPRAWTIYEGKLYLNFSLGIRRIWSNDIPSNIRRADRNWQRLRVGQ